MDLFWGILIGCVLNPLTVNGFRWLIAYFDTEEQNMEEDDEEKDCFD